MTSNGNGAGPDRATRIERCVEILDRAWRTGEPLDRLPTEVAPRDRLEAYEVQARSVELGGRPTVGWKIAATSAAGQRHINVEGPLAGRVPDDRVYPDGAAVPLRGNTMCLAEQEFVFMIGQPLPARAEPYSVEETTAAVAALHFGIELPSTRYVDVTSVGACQLIADHAVGHRFVLGPVARGPWSASELKSVTMTATVDGPAGQRSIEGTGANVLGDPVAALNWLVNELSGIGVGLEPGQFVTTGTCGTPIPVVPGETVTARFQDLGAVSCTLVD